MAQVLQILQVMEHKDENQFRRVHYQSVFITNQTKIMEVVNTMTEKEATLFNRYLGFTPPPCTLDTEQRAASLSCSLNQHCICILIVCMMTTSIWLTQCAFNLLLVSQYRCFSIQRYLRQILIMLLNNGHNTPLPNLRSIQSASCLASNIIIINIDRGLLITQIGLVSILQDPCTSSCCLFKFCLLYYFYTI